MSRLDVAPSTAIDRREATPAPIPFRIRIGVTGHRHLGDPAGLEAVVADVVRRIRALIPERLDTPVRLTVVSALAEMSDRLMARVILTDPEACLEAPLPFPAEDYCQDFERPESVAEFQSLLGRARYAPVRESFAGEERTDGYQAVGRYVSDRADFLIAIWDGSPPKGRGGTAEVVERAKAGHVPVFHIDAAAPHSVHEPDPGDLERGCDSLKQEFAAVEKYNAQLTRQVRRPRTVDQDDQCARQCIWAEHHFDTADALARRYQRIYRGGLLTSFLLAALAVGAVATQVLLDEWERYGNVEAVAIVLVAVVWLVCHRSRVHPLYLGFRFLAERLREAPFLALSGLQQVQPNPFSPEFVGYPSEGWPWRMFDEVWSLRPDDDRRPDDVEAVRTFLAEQWIAAQRRFHKRTERLERARQQRLTVLVLILFLVTSIAAVLHGFEIIGPAEESHPHPSDSTYSLLVFVSVTFGAVGAALSGYAAQRGYRREAARSRQMVVYLRFDEERMRTARTFGVITKVAEETEAHMLSENRSWFGDLLFEEIELHT